MEGFISSINIGVSDVVAIIGALTGLLSVIFAFYSKKREANIKDAELELKNKHFIADKNHSISKEKYQSLFEKKIDLYINLRREVLMFNNKIYRVGHAVDVQDIYGDIINKELTEDHFAEEALKNIFKLIENNNFVVSEYLYVSYKTIYDIYHKEFHELERLYSHNEIDHEDYYNAKPEVMKKAYPELKEPMLSFFDQIEKETKEIKSKIDGI